MAMSPQTTKRFFTVAEAAGLLGLSEPTLYRAIRAGEFPAIKVRGRYVVPAKAIDEMELSAMAAAVTNSVPGVA
jgi:excisionase family DNA binding protein